MPTDPPAPPVPTGVLEEERHPERFRIDDVEEVRGYITGIDFAMLKAKLSAAPGLEGGLGWTTPKVDAVETQYKNWLFLRRKHEGESLPPSPDIDQFWHAHMLDTRAYHRDCARIFGTYHHHYPYFGARSASDREALLAAWERTLTFYESEFGEPIYQIGDNG